MPKFLARLLRSLPFPTEKPVGYPTQLDHMPPSQSAKRGTAYPTSLDLAPPLHSGQQLVAVPVTVNHDQSRIIGSIELEKDQIPHHPNYRFEVGGVVRDAAVEWDDDLGRHIKVIKDFELTEVSLVMEDREAA